MIWHRLRDMLRRRDSNLDMEIDALLRDIENWQEED